MSDLDWRPAWASAQALWGVQLHDPELVAEPDPPSFAWFSFPPQITVDVPALTTADAAAELESVFAHEIGHHVLSPSTRLDSLKLRHQLGRALLASDRPAPADLLNLLSNLWSDQLINLRVAARPGGRTGHDPALAAAVGGEADGPTQLGAPAGLRALLGAAAGHAVRG